MTRFFPKSLFGQTLLVLLVGLVASHLVGSWIYSLDRSQILRAVGGELIVQRITNLARLVDEAPEEWRARIVAAASEETFTAALSPEAPQGPMEDEDLPAAEALRQLLTEQLSPDGSIRPLVSASQPRGMVEGLARQMRERNPMMRGVEGLGPLAGFRDLQVAVPLRDGQWLTFTTVLPESGAAFSPRFLVSMGIMALITLLVAVWAVRRVTAPLGALGQAARRLGEDLDAPPMVETGTVETRQAAQAFNAMQARLRRMIEDRSQMLAAISHDFRTPLTLLRLRVENVEDPAEREKMLATIADLDAMVAATLAFASDGAKAAPRRPTDVAALLASIVDDMEDGGLPVRMEEAEPAIYPCDPASLKRALTNLVDNALKYGERASVALRKTGRGIEIAIDDDGPGIPEAELTQVFEPLYRLESSRSRETGGMGLGLAITLSIIRAHGGQLTLANRPEGGLRALVVLP